MKPKEKAKELIGRFYASKISTNRFRKEESKQCALICVDEKFKPDFIGGKRYDLGLEQILYWQEVKTEINKL